MKGLRLWRVALPLVLLLSLAGHALGQAYPSRPIRLIVPYPPGGASDLHARHLAAKLTDLAQPIIVENRVGAAGNVAFDYVAKAAPDGYTLLWGAGSMTVAPALTARLPFDVVNDFAPISLVVVVQNVLMVPAGSAVKTVPELIAAAKAQPGKLNYASAGAGGIPHLTMELFRSMTGTDIAHIPYKGDSPALVDLIAGRVDMYFATIAGGIQHIKSGKVRALGVSARKRAAALPDVPTLDEAGVPGYEVVSWFGVLAPAGTPRDAVNLVHAHIVKAVAQADLKEKYVGLGSEPTTNSPQEFHALVRESVLKFAQIAKGAGIKPE
jgi:tripartite-type tricarboxylate transporter receptor subunit TctC